MECEHGWTNAADCDTCTLQRVAPQAYDRIVQLEAALEPFARMAESYEDERASFVIASKGGTIVSVYNLREAEKLLDSKHR